MFGCNDNNKESPATIPMRLHGDFKIWIDNNLAAWYVPCRKIDTGVLGLYDVVSSQFLTSTTAFVSCGEDVQNSLLNDKVATLNDLENKVDTTSTQTITGVKNFKNGFLINGLKVEKDSSDRIAFYFSNSPKVKIGQLDTLFANRVTPDSSNTHDLGRSGVYWRDLYLSGGLSDGTNKISVATIASFADKPNKDEVVDLESNQEVNGIKTFTTRPLVKSLVPKIPETYQEVEYIESTGTQYIDTLFRPNEKTTIRIDFQLTSTTQTQGIFGVSEQGAGKTYRLGVSGAGYFYFAQKGNQYNGSASSSDTNRNVFEVKNGKMFRNDVEYTTITDTSSFQCDYNAYIFYFSGNTSIQPASGKLYSLTMYDNGTLVRNFVPCYRKSDNVIGLYDTVYNAFYANQGTGDFLKGAGVITSVADKAVSVAAITDIPDAYTKTESDSRYIPYAGQDTLKGGLLIGNGGLTLGANNGNGLLFPSSVISQGTQSSIGVYNPSDDNYCTLVGFISGTFTIGHSAFATNIRGANARPTYNGNELALKSDVGSTDSCVDTTSNQEIGGVKTFNERPLIKITGTRLPSDYQEVEYIESTGTQYIDTGVYATVDTGYSLEFLTTHLSDQILFGAQGITQLGTNAGGVADSPMSTYFG